MKNFLTGTSNADYHADKTHLSSSGLKLLLQDPQQFYKEYILGERVVRESAAFTEGTLVHSLILEPHFVPEQYAVYPGYKRAGGHYQSWVKANANGRIVVTAAQMERAKELAKACLSNSDIRDRLSGGQAELSLVSVIDGVPVKCRADYINVEGGYIDDIKTTSKPTGVEIFKETIMQFEYDLSAALYCRIAKDNFGKDFKFNWDVISKADKGVLDYQATTEDLRLGLAKVIQAIEIYKHCMNTGVWELPKSTLTLIQKEKKMSNTFKTNKGTELPLMNLKGKPYLQVAHRFVMLNDDTNRFTIETKFLVLTSEETVCQAEVQVINTEPGREGEVLRRASGTKRETKKDFADHTEKAETGAIGRALAMLGYGTQFAIQDMDEGERLADAPVIPAKRAPKVVAKASGDEF